MASGDTPNVPKHMTFSKSHVPLIGALIDYIYTSVEYILYKSFTRGQQLRPVASNKTLSATFMAFICFSLSFICNVKFEIVRFDEEPLPLDLHFMLMSNVQKLYIDDIDISKVKLCIEASDVFTIVISSLLIWGSSNMRPPMREYFYLPWLGVTMRGIILRQAPTTVALLYTMFIISEQINPLFLSAFSLLFILETLLWLDIARIVYKHWEKRDHFNATRDGYEVETLWSNDDVQSVEVRNYIY